MYSPHAHTYTHAHAHAHTDSGTGSGTGPGEFWDHVPYKFNVTVGCHNQGIFTAQNKLVQGAGT